MANKTIENLDALDINNYNPDEDLLIVQKPNGATYHMSATNIMNPVAGGMVFLNKSYNIGSFAHANWSNESFNTSNSSVPSTASAAFISLDNSGSGTPRFQFRFFTSSDYSTENMHEFSWLNLSSKDQQGINTCFVPIINGVIYYSVYNDTSGTNGSGNRLSINMHAYM